MGPTGSGALAKACLHCGESFEPRSGHGGLCSKPCQDARKKVMDAAYRVKHRERIIDERRKSRYGVGAEQVAGMMEAQGHACAICSRSPFKPVVDHCHRNGTVRGLLCHNCNLALGHARDNPDILVAAANYLHSFVC